jgi:hypothetical protein
MGYPWVVTIENGTAIAIKNDKGGSAAQKGSFATESKAFMRLTDAKWEQMLLSVVAYIDAFEKAYCIKSIKDAKTRIEAERAAFAQAKQQDAAAQFEYSQTNQQYC